MKKDLCFYNFIITYTACSGSQVRRLSVDPKSFKRLTVLLVTIFCAALYGLYGLAQQVSHLHVASENERLRGENDRQRRQLNILKNRVEAIEDESRRLTEKVGIDSGEATATTARGAGGPALPIKGQMAALIERKTMHLEEALRSVELAWQKAQEQIPSVWPVAGETSDNFGLRRDPFRRTTREFHPGKDIAAPAGTPVVATGSGRVIFAGVQGSYGRLVILDHGNNLTTRYGHLSKINVTANQTIERGTEVGRVGSTGRSTGPHLHYEVRSSQVPVDPGLYLPGI